MKFTLTIELGNATMQTFDDLARTLRELAMRFQNEHALVETAPFYDRNGRIGDFDGNAVGRWEAK